MGRFYSKDFPREGVVSEKKGKRCSSEIGAEGGAVQRRKKRKANSGDGVNHLCLRLGFSLRGEENVVSEIWRLEVAREA